MNQDVYEEYDVLSLTGYAGDAADLLVQMEVCGKGADADPFSEDISFADLYLRTFWNDPEKAQYKKDVLIREEIGEIPYEEMRILLPSISRVIGLSFCEGSNPLSPEQGQQEHDSLLLQALYLCTLEKMLIGEKLQQRSIAEAESLFQDAIRSVEQARLNYDAAIRERQRFEKKGYQQEIDFIE